MSIPQFIVCTAYNLYNKSNSRDVYWQDKTQPINLFFILKSCNYRFLPHSYQFVTVSSLSKHSTTCNLSYWQRRQINNSYKLQEARQTCRCVLLMKVHDDISHGVIRCVWVSYCRPHVNRSDHWPLSAGARYVYLVRSVQTGRGADPQPPIPLVLGALSQGIYWPGRKAYKFPPSSPEVKNEWTWTSTPPYVFMACTGTTFLPYSSSEKLV